MISVVIPVYNGGNYIIRAFESAVKQRVEKEIIIVDDASTDNYMSIFLAHYDKKPLEAGNEAEENVELYWQGIINDTEVTILKNKSNKGTGEARNIGVRMAKGEYIAFLDCDDLWTEDKLKRQLLCLEKTGAVMCNTARELINSNGITTGVIINTPKTITLKHLERTNCINCSSVLIRREAMLKYPMEHSDAHEDYYVWLKIFREYKMAPGLDYPMLKYRLSPGSKAGNKIKSAKMTYRTYRYAGYGVLRALLMMISYIYYGIKKYKDVPRNKVNKI